jgi:hypothetical protein
MMDTKEFLREIGATSVTVFAARNGEWAMRVELEDLGAVVVADPDEGQLVPMMRAAVELRRGVS